MSTILITGGTGMIGKHLTELLLKEGHKVIVVSRYTNKPSTTTNLQYAAYDIDKQTIDRWAIEEADCIVHLAGANVAEKRWSEERKKEIQDSRVLSSQLLVKAASSIPNKIKVVVSASAIGWYGPDSDKNLPKGFDESMPSFDDFLGKTCHLWEEAIEPIEHSTNRLVKLRFGIVLSDKGGALPELLIPIKTGIAGIIGKGKQVISWIHIEDVCRIILYSIQNEKMKGVYNTVAPEPVSNKKIALAIASIKRGRFFIPIHIPAFLIRWLLGEMSIEVLKSVTVSCEKIHAAGFTFLFPTVEAALKDLLTNKKTAKPTI